MDSPVTFLNLKSNHKPYSYEKAHHTSYFVRTDECPASFILGAEKSNGGNDPNIVQIHSDGKRNKRRLYLQRL